MSLALCSRQQSVYRLPSMVACRMYAAVLYRKNDLRDRSLSRIIRRPSVGRIVTDILEKCCLARTSCYRPATLMKQSSAAMLEGCCNGHSLPGRSSSPCDGSADAQQDRIIIQRQIGFGG